MSFTRQNVAQHVASQQSNCFYLVAVLSLPCCCTLCDLALCFASPLHVLHSPSAYILCSRLDCRDRRYSAAVCRRPRLVIASCVVATLTCSLGLFRVKIITNPDLIWVSVQQCSAVCRARTLHVSPQQLGSWVLPHPGTHLIHLPTQTHVYQLVAMLKLFHRPLSCCAMGSTAFGARFPTCCLDKTGRCARSPTFNSVRLP